MSTTIRPERLPVVLYLPGDLAAHAALEGSHKFRRVAWKGPAPQHESGAVLLISSEQTLREYFARVRGDSRLQIIALSEVPFRDPRLDGAVYAYLPTRTSLPLIERMVENALSQMYLTSARQEFHQRLAEASREIDELNRIGAALSAEHDTDTLLDLILRKSRAITGADAGSLYVVEEHEGERRLRFVLAQNDSIALPFRQSTIAINAQSVAGYVALTGETVNIDDAYSPPTALPVSVDRRFDDVSGYRTKSMLAVAMRNPKQEIIGVVQLINCKRNPAAKLTTLAAVEAETTGFTERHRELVTSLASQAAVALENSRLMADIQRLFEGFVRASVTAIEERDPATCGHSFRVAGLTLGLAEACERAGKLHFTREQIKEIRYAALLHDFGKVGVPEDVLLKAYKLYPLQLEVVRHRFQLAQHSAEAGILRARLEFALRHGAERYRQEEGRFDAELARETAELAAFWELVQHANIPTVRVEGCSDRLSEIAARNYTDVDGQLQPLLSPAEVRLLSIPKGSLDEEERRKIEAHVERTYQFLSQIPWTTDLGGVPRIARAHHEKLNGRGYPHKLTAPQIPVQARMITISDMYDGLTASDRPYKRAVPIEQALDMLGQAATRGEIDQELVTIFRDARVYQRRET